jgi:hypothetical protein
MLQATLGTTAYKTLEILVGSPTPLTGRAVGIALDKSPTTANKSLNKLRASGFAGSSKQGRGNYWHVNSDDGVIRTWLEELRDNDRPPAEMPVGMSPYATGGGGVTFERKVGVKYLAHLLAGDGATELGDGRSVVHVRFQQSPEHAVDDLVIHASRVDDVEPSLVLAVGVRRNPNLVQSDESSQKLIRSFVEEIIHAPTDGPEHRVALVVAGAQDHAEQLSLLAGLAAKQLDASNFFNLVRTPNRFPAAVRERLKQTEAMVKHALVELGVPEPAADVVEQRTWELLSRLEVLLLRLESPDEADWAAIVNALTNVARGGDLYGAARLRDRLVALASEYPPAAATVDRTLLMRDTHVLLDTTQGRDRQGWQALELLHDQAIAATRGEITSEDGRRTIRLDRSDSAAAILEVAASGKAALVAHGESGIGKSTLVVQAAIDASDSNPDLTQTLCVNLRHLPATSLELESHLGAPLRTLLAELSAPQRLLVIDGADAISEGMLEPFRYLIDASHQAGVTVIAVSASDTKQSVRDTLAEHTLGDVAEYAVRPLTDEQIDEVVGTFEELGALAANLRSRELLRRPVVVDLLVRGGLSGTPLSDADAMVQVWSGLVRRREPDRGTPTARELALLGLADLALFGGDALDKVAALDSVALDGLQQDGLLRTPPDDPFRIGPDFAHDELRRYAVARVLLSAGDATSKLIDAGVPRWVLGAARLACQALLSAPDSPGNPMRGRLSRVQKSFDDLVNAGHGARWGDVPGEALLTLGDPEPVLLDAWPYLCGEPGEGLKRLSRLVEQRLRDQSGRVRAIAVEPLIHLLLEEPAPWRTGQHIQDLLREWLRTLVVANAPAGHPLRLRLRELLVTECGAADRRLKDARAGAAAARAVRTSEEVEAERRARERHRSRLTEIGYPRSRRRAQAELPREITDETVVELLALLGPDLGHDGEAILRRIGRDAPSRLHPAVEEMLTGRALATYGGGLLAWLTEAYYIDQERGDWEWSLLDDGIRRHHSRSLGMLVPLAAWYRGPFAPLFQTDLVKGIAVLNRMLNHAALARERSGARAAHLESSGSEDSLAQYRIELEITRTRRAYIGDGGVWNWYRGTGVGPYPCISALLALERTCDDVIERGIPMSNLISALLDGCDNLAMVGLVVGLLVRHLDPTDRLLDRYLAEPIIWHLEFSRVAQESSGLAAASEGISAPQRRHWSLREAAMWVVVRADVGRADELRIVGQQLVVNMQRLLEEAVADGDVNAIEEEMAPVRAWASGLDQRSYTTRATDEGLYIESTPPEEVIRAMELRNADIRRAQDSMRLIHRYYILPRQGGAEPISADDFVADLAAAEVLLASPSELDTAYQWDAPAAVAAAAIEANLTNNVDLPEHALRFAVRTVLRVGLGESPPPRYESEESFFEQGVDRSAARVLPLLLLPQAEALRALAEPDGSTTSHARVTSAASFLAGSIASEVRLHLARGLDAIWNAPCGASGTCHHQMGLQITIETMRNCVFGDWDPMNGPRAILPLDDPVVQSLGGVPDNAVYFSRLDAAIRAVAPAAMASICVSKEARDLLSALLAAHRRAQLAFEDNFDDRGTHALVAARALLTLAAGGDDAEVFEHVDAYADNPMLLGGFLRAVSAAAEESPTRAAAARRIWPTLISHILDLHDSGLKPFGGWDHYGDTALATLVPNPAGEVSYLYRELDGEPIVWWNPSAWAAVVDRWLPHARGNATCVDQLIAFLKSSLGPDDQIRLGLPWVVDIVLADPARIATRSFLTTAWLIENRATAADAGLLPDWQRVVDALVVAGVNRLAPYSE